MNMGVSEENKGKETTIKSRVNPERVSSSGVRHGDSVRKFRDPPFFCSFGCSAEDAIVCEGQLGKSIHSPLGVPNLDIEAQEQTNPKMSKENKYSCCAERS